MPVFLPPGQGVNVTLPGPAPAKPQAPPQPFNQIQGPAVTILPHLPGEGEKTPPQASQPPT